MTSASEFLRCHDVRIPAQPELTLVVCCYNQSAYVQEAIVAAERVRAAVDSELLFIDDGSTDESFELALHALASSENYLIATKRNCGLVHSLNTGLGLARGRLILFIAADDRLLAQGVVAACRHLNAQAGARFFLANALYFGDGIKTRPVYREEHGRYFESAPDLRFPIVPSRLPAPLLLQATIFRTGFLRSIGGWDADVVLDDMSMFLRIFSVGPIAGSDFLYDLKLMLSEYRQHVGNTSRRVVYQFQIYEQCILKYCNADVQRAELAHALGTYLLYGIRQRDRGAITVLLRAAARYNAIGKTLREVVRRVLRRTIRDVTASGTNARY